MLKLLQLVCAVCSSSNVRILGKHGYIKCNDCGHEDHGI